MKRERNMKKSSEQEGKKSLNRNILTYEVYEYSLCEYIKYLSVGAALGLIICWLCYHSLYSLPLAAAIAFYYMIRKKKELCEKRKKTLLYHFKELIGSLHTSLNAGYSVENGVREALNDMKSLYGANDVIVKELKLMQSGLMLGRPIEELFKELGERSGLADIKLFAELLASGKRSGGRLGKILADTKHIICGKIDTEQEIDRQLAAKKYEQKIMSLMPACIIIYLRLTFSGFIESLYGNIVGVAVMTVCLIVYAVAYHMAEKIVDISF